MEAPEKKGRRGSKNRSKWQPHFVLSSPLDPIGDQNDVRSRPLYLVLVLGTRYNVQCTIVHTYILYILYILYIFYMLYIWYKLYTLYILFILYIMYTLYIRYRTYCTCHRHHPGARGRPPRGPGGGAARTALGH